MSKIEVDLDMCVLWLPVDVNRIFENEFEGETPLDEYDLSNIFYDVNERACSAIGDAISEAIRTILEEREEREKEKAA